jgi:hypothetical protein
MKKISFLVLVSLFSNILFAQDIVMSETELKAQLDSVLVEAHLLYRYEKAAWIATDLARANRSVNRDFFSFLAYEEQEEIKVIIVGKQINCIAEYTFENDFTKPKSAKIESRELTDKENKLLHLRDEIIDNIIKAQHEIGAPNGYALNFILIPYEDKFKFYIITGTSQRDVIPFGNDWIFITDENGEIESWHQFHSRLVPGHTTFNGHKVRELTHSHLRTTPLITATDIATFMLYAPLYDIDAFSVYSPALGKTMKYSLKNNEITIK